MTREQAKELWPLVKALAEGKEIECNASINPKGWCAATHLETCNFDLKMFRYRIKPEPKYRPWKPEEVPMPCVVRAKDTDCVQLVLWKHSNHICIGSSDYTIDYIKLYNEWEHSLDHGKAWLPCGELVEE